MIAASLVTAVCWMVFCLYWLVGSRSVKATEEKAGGIGGYRHYVLAFLAFVSLYIPAYPLTVPLLSHATLIGILGSVFAIGGLGVAIVARRTLASNWSATVTFKEDHTLVTTGIYRYARHPIYTGFLLMFLGTAALVSTLGALIGFVVVLLTFWFKLKQEEALMARHFPRDYPAYKRRVKALVPYVF